jgi:hypothetical protein
VHVRVICRANMLFTAIAVHRFDPSSWKQKTMWESGDHSFCQQLTFKNEICIEAHLEMQVCGSVCGEVIYINRRSRRSTKITGDESDPRLSLSTRKPEHIGIVHMVLTAVCSCSPPSVSLSHTPNHPYTARCSCLIGEPVSIQRK